MAPSTKIKYDVSDVEAGGGGKQPQPALYNGRIVAATKRLTKANGDPANDIEVQVALEDESYAHLYTYIGLGDSTRWKMREFTDAVGVPPKGELDLGKLKNKPVLVKVAADTDQDGDYRGKIKNLFKPGSIEDADIAAPSASGNGAGDGDGDGGGVTATEMADWSDDDLKEEIEAKGIEVAGRWTRDKAIEAILEYHGPGDSGDAAAPTGDAPEIPEELVPDLFDNAEAYSSWPDADIKSYVDDLNTAGVDVPIEGRYGKVKAIEALVKLGQLYHGTGGEEPEADADADTPDADGEVSDEYDSWSDTDVEDEIRARQEQGAELPIEGRKSREKMIEALRKDDKPF